MLMAKEVRRKHELWRFAQCMCANQVWEIAITMDAVVFFHRAFMA